MNKGILLLFLSQYKENARGKEYQAENNDNGKLYEGIQTDDAPVKYLFDCAYSQGDKIDKILCIVTQRVKKEKSFEKFQQMIIGYINQEIRLRECYQESSPVFCQIDYDENVESTSERASNVYRQISRELFSDEPSNVYIDYTGGLRDISFLMTVITRYLEYMNFKCKKIVYSNLRTESEKGVIHSIDCVYDLFTLINGVDQFVRTGNAELLGKCYENEKDEETRKLLSLIIRFSQIISICNIQEIDSILPEIGKGLRDYRKNRETDSLYLKMFADMIGVIRKKLYIHEDASFEYPDLIRWCLDNNMIQQALTLYIEKMPVYYYEKNLLKMPENLEITNSGKTKETIAFYERLFDDRLKDEKIEELKTALKTLDTRSDTFLIENLNRLKRNLSSECRRAISRLVQFLKQYYVNGIGKRNDISMKVNPFGEQVIKRGDKCINSLHNSPRALYYFLYGKEYENPFKGTYHKKVIALEKVKEEIDLSKECNVKRETLYQMMKYYLVLKLIRNRTNHASESKQEPDEQEAVRLLKERHAVSPQLELKNIKELILQGLQAHVE